MSFSIQSVCDVLLLRAATCDFDSSAQIAAEITCVYDQEYETAKDAKSTVLSLASCLESHGIAVTDLSDLMIQVDDLAKTALSPSVDLPHKATPPLAQTVKNESEPSTPLKRIAQLVEKLTTELREAEKEEDPALKDLLRYHLTAFRHDATGLLEKRSQPSSKAGADKK